jgi:putative ABC transport system permease protein
MIEGNYNISLNSRLEGKKAIRDTKILLFALGGGVSAVIGLIGILNFVNVMSVGIMVRKRELAILESIGMSQGQMRKMLISEGIGYAAITILLVVSIGNLITLSIFQLFLKNIEYMVITYPIIPIVIVFMIILTVCMITPKVVYGNINKSTLVERLREAE